MGGFGRMIGPALGGALTGAGMMGGQGGGPGALLGGLLGGIGGYGYGRNARRTQEKAQGAKGWLPGPGTSGPLGAISGANQGTLGSTPGFSPMAATPTMPNGVVGPPLPPYQTPSQLPGMTPSYGQTGPAASIPGGYEGPMRAQFDPNADPNAMEGLPPYIPLMFGGALKTRAFNR